MEAKQLAQGHKTNMCRIRIQMQALGLRKPCSRRRVVQSTLEQHGFNCAGPLTHGFFNRPAHFKPIVPGETPSLDIYACMDFQPHGWWAPLTPKLFKGQLYLVMILHIDKALCSLHSCPRLFTAVQICEHYAAYCNPAVHIK